MALERKPIQLLDAAKSKLDTQLSSYGKLQASLSAVRDAARKLTDPGAWTATTVDLQRRGSGQRRRQRQFVNPATTRVEVTRLAAAQSLTSATLPRPASIVGTGTLTIEMGQWFTDPPDFTPTAGTNSVSIVIGPDDRHAGEGARQDQRSRCRRHRVDRQRRQRLAAVDSLQRNRREQRLSHPRDRRRRQERRRSRPVDAVLRSTTRRQPDDAGAGRIERDADGQQHPDRLGQQHAHRRARRPDAAGLARDHAGRWT